MPSAYNKTVGIALGEIPVDVAGKITARFHVQSYKGILDPTDDRGATFAVQATPHASGDAGWFTIFSFNAESLDAVRAYRQVAADAGAGSTSITLTDASPVRPGGLMAIIRNADPSIVEVVRAKSISGAVVTLDAPCTLDKFQWDYVTFNAQQFTAEIELGGISRLRFLRLTNVTNEVFAWCTMSTLDTVGG